MLTFCTSGQEPKFPRRFRTIKCQKLKAVHVAHALVCLKRSRHCSSIHLSRSVSFQSLNSIHSTCHILRLSDINNNVTRVTSALAIPLSPLASSAVCSLGVCLDRAWEVGGGGGAIPLRPKEKKKKEKEKSSYVVSTCAATRTTIRLCTCAYISCTCHAAHYGCVPV